MLVYITGGNIYEDWYAKFKGTELVFNVEFSEYAGRYRLKDDKSFTIYGAHATIINANIAVLEDNIIDKLTDRDKSVKARPTIQKATADLLYSIQESIDEFNDQMNGAIIKQINIVPEYQGSDDGVKVVSLIKSELILNC